MAQSEYGERIDTFEEAVEELVLSLAYVHNIDYRSKNPSNEVIFGTDVIDKKTENFLYAIDDYTDMGISYLKELFDHAWSIADDELE